MARPITDQDREAIRQLHAQGKSRNEIAQAIGRSGSTVSRLAAEMGLTFTRGEQVLAATEAAKIDARRKRAALAVALLDEAETMRKELHGPIEVYKFGGKDNTLAVARVAKPNPADKRDLMQAIGLAIERSLRLDAYDSGAGLPTVLSLLETIGRGLVAKYGTGDDQPGGDPAPGDGADG